MKHIKVHVFASAEEELIQKISDDTYAISVRQPAQANRANTRVVEILKELYTATRVRLVSGGHTGHKIFEIG